MKIIVPMAGSGLRFSTAGFKELKSLIRINGKPMIEHVCDMFPGEENFIFVCRKEHLENTELGDVLLRIKPNAEIVEIAQKTLGPVHTTLFAEELVDDDEEVIVNYADFVQVWDYKKFLEAVRNSADGALPAFRGFHPASLGNTYYAYMRVDSKNRLLEIREKSSFSQNRMEDYASTGTHYFARGEYMKKYAKELMNSGTSINGEFYFSLPYNFMVRDGLSVLVYEVPKFICFGTPFDLYQYNFWSSYHQYEVWQKFYGERKPAYDAVNLIPAAGVDKRFDAYAYPKMLIPVDKNPMIIKSIKTLPDAKKWVFIFLEGDIRRFSFDKVVKEAVPDATIISIPQPTRGMAETCVAAEKELDMNKPLLISACDYAVQYDEEKFRKLTEDDTIDVIVWTLRNHASVMHNPYEYAYVAMGRDRATHISEKMPISHTPWEDHAVVSTFYFKKASLFIDSAKKLLKEGRSIKGQYYVATSINELIAAGKKVVPFEVEKFVCWGTPEDLKEYEYWKEYFNSMKLEKTAA